MAKQTPYLYSLGYSKLTESVFYSLLDQYEITGLIDVRVAPSSIKPEYRRKYLEAACRNRQLDYWWVGKELGGKGQVEVQNKLLRPEGQKSLGDIHAECVAGKRRWALLCLEKCWQKCAPRSLLGKELAQRGVSVVHISMASDPEVMGCQPLVAVEDGGQVALETAKITKPAQQVAQTGTGTHDVAPAAKSRVLELAHADQGSRHETITFANRRRWKNLQSRHSEQLAAASTEMVDMAMLQQPAASTATSEVIPNPPWLSQLSSLVEWRRQGLLDEAEFTAFKGKLLDGCGSSGSCLQFSNHRLVCQSFQLHACSHMQGQACDS